MCTTSSESANSYNAVTIATLLDIALGGDSLAAKRRSAMCLIPSCKSCYPPFQNTEVPHIRIYAVEPKYAN